MENKKPNPVAPLPWYDDQVEAVRKNDVTLTEKAVEEPTQYTPKEIYEYLSQHVWKQEQRNDDANCDVRRQRQ